MPLLTLFSLFQRLRRTPLRAWPTVELHVQDAAALYMFSFLFSATLGVVRQVLLNARFGLGPEAAAYYAAVRLPDTIAILIAGGTLTNALLPVLIRVATRDGEPAAQRLVNRTLTLLMVVVAPFTLGVALAMPWFVDLLLAPGFEPSLQDLTSNLARIMLLDVLLLVAEAGLIAVLMSRNQVLLPALAIGLRNVTVIAGVGIAYLVPEVGIYGPAVGLVVDTIVQIAVLVPGLRQRNYRPQLLWQPQDRDLRLVGRLLWPNALGGVSNSSGAIVDTAFVSLTKQTAAVGALANAWLLIGLPVRLLGVAVGQAALPRLADLSNRGDLAAMRRTIRRMLLVVSGTAILTMLLLIGLGRPLIQLLFERGAFDSAAVALTMQLFTLYAIGLPAYVLTEVAARALVARYDTLSAMAANMVQLALRIILLTILIEPLGPQAIPVAHVISSLIETIMLLVILGLRTRGV
ncbi:MAG: murein biosynthesis integral membrane protein MurJ [Candidatus Viridilinea halotolerans]|uniref:Murein biosynthesis integral membrane protein MurJ n=1 Tax=Candidatus Viridilinea halotolerans TaxID=2491704 RepID=A0A426TR11_9CHLR|nr:MAG: murein biosynthesis integral membrane protein MurJ [Candidatus Viridilinea halotolerans]